MADSSRDSLHGLFEAGRDEDTLRIEGLDDLERALFGRETTEERPEWGRHVPLQKLGQGGHGVVYAAFDPELRRKVAIKLLRSVGPGSAVTEERLIREARALSKVSHPHVVPIYDIGRLERGVFLVMKLIEGQRLDEWWATRQGSWAEIMRAFVQAGRALEAAHELGIVHRDFKPGNVLVESTPAGPHVTVLDFGLAQALGEPSKLPATAHGGDHEPDTVSDTADDRLTATGLVVGTPRYMSPEQHRSQAIDGRSDQYSYCTVLHEALAGPLPWHGLAPRAARLAKETQPAVRCRRGVPKEVASLIQRGLAPDPDRRFQSIAELVDALESLPRRRRRRRIVGWSGVALAVPVLAMFGSNAVAERSCEAEAEAVAQIFTAERDAALRDRFSGATAYAESTYDWVSSFLTGYRDDVGAQLVDSCKATRLRGEQSDAMRGKRDACLQHRVDALGAVLDAMDDAYPSEVGSLPDVVTGLPQIDDCQDEARLSKGAAAWAGPSPQLERARREAETRGLLGAQSRAISQLQALADQAEDADDRASLARVQLSLGQAHRWRNELDIAREVLAEALLNAEAAGDSETVTRVLRSLGEAHLDKDADRMLELVERAAARVEHDPVDDLLQGRIGISLAHVNLLQGHTTVAAQAADEARRHLSETLGEMHPSVAEAGRWYAMSLHFEQRHPEAREAYEEADRIFVETLGASHPKRRRVLENWGVMELDAGSYAAGRDVFVRLQRAIPEREGPHLPAKLWARVQEGRARLHLGEPGGLQIIEEALRALGQTPEAGGAPHAELLHGVAGTMIETGREPRALQMLDDAEAMLEGSMADTHPTLQKIRKRRALITGKGLERP